MHVALLHRKVNDGRLQKPMSFQIKWLDRGVVTVTPESLDSVPDFVTELPLADQIIQQLRDNGPQTVRKLAEATGANPRSLSVIVSRSPKFQKVGNDRWDITGQ